jgi:hypothetical protein
MPNTETDEPIRANERNERELPRWTKSKTDILLLPVDPAEAPNTERVDPKRTNERTDRELPT